MVAESSQGLLRAKRDAYRTVQRYLSVRSHTARTQELECAMYASDANITMAPKHSHSSPVRVIAAFPLLSFA